MSSNSTGGAADTPKNTGLGKCNVVCPMCAHAHVQYRLNPRMFWHTQTDLDGKPEDFHTLKGIEGCYPPLYEFWHCPKCHFTSGNRTFLDPLKNVFVEKSFVQRQYEEKMRADGPLQSVCDLLGDSLQSEEISFLQAIRMAMLAVLSDRFFSEVLNQRYAALARSYLRLAWLQRDWEKIDPAYNDSVAEFKALMGRVSADWPEAPETENDALRGALESFSRALEEPAVSGSDKETVEILLIIVKLHLQIQDGASAAALQECRAEASRVLQETTAELNRDVHEKKLSSKDRSQKVAVRRRMEKVLSECQDLKEKIR